MISLLQGPGCAERIRIFLFALVSIEIDTLPVLPLLRKMCTLDSVQIQSEFGEKQKR